MFEIKIGDTPIGRVSCIAENSPSERWVARPICAPDPNIGKGKPFASRKAAVEWLVGGHTSKKLRE